MSPRAAALAVGARSGDGGGGGGSGGKLWQPDGVVLVSRQDLEKFGGRPALYTLEDLC